MNNKKNKKMWLYFTTVIFATIFIVFFITSLMWMSVSYVKLGKIDIESRRVPILFFLIGSILLGFVVTLCVGKVIIQPLQKFSKAFDEIARGNFEYRLSKDAKFDEINQMAEKLNAMAFDLGHIETLRSDFVANVSHEFKTPLATIEGYATLLQNDSLTKEKREYYLDKILENTRRLTGLSTHVLTLSKLENQGNFIEHHEFRLDEQIRKAILMLEDKWSEKNIAFDLELPKQMYDGNEALLIQVWINLLDNAIKCSYENGIIHVSLKEIDQKKIIMIQDEGIGMSLEVQKHIFEKFYQGDLSRQSEGNGLGLALVKRIIELCHASIEVKSEEGKGATFIVALF